MLITMTCMQDGAALSTKYQSKRKVFGTCHVVVFANAFPDKSKLTQDRWEIVDLAKEKGHEEKGGGWHSVCTDHCGAPPATPEICGKDHLP